MHRRTVKYRDWQFIGVRPLLVLTIESYTTMDNLPEALKCLEDLWVVLRRLDVNR
jgi:hypothetical protein